MGKTSQLMNVQIVEREAGRGGAGWGEVREIERQREEWGKET